MWIESPTNPLMDVMDVRTVLDAARARGVLSVVDNTLPTPLGCRPLTLGADVVVHSATKYIAGHSDVLLGVTVVADDAGGAEIGERLRRHRTLHGAIAGPLEVYLGLRGLRTLALRYERASANAAELATRLHGHPAAERVRYPGSGAMLSIDVPGDADAAERVCAATRVVGALDQSWRRRVTARAASSPALRAGDRAAQPHPPLRRH